MGYALLSSPAILFPTSLYQLQMNWHEYLEKEGTSIWKYNVPVICCTRP
jgi:hypothetical protein